MNRTRKGKTRVWRSKGHLARIAELLGNKAPRDVPPAHRRALRTNKPRTRRLPLAKPMAMDTTGNFWVW